MSVFLSIKFAIEILLFLGQVLAFDADGHSAIGMTTISGLQNNFSQKLKRLMNGKDIVDISGWGERVSKKHPSTLPFHFQSQNKSDYLKDGIEGGEYLKKKHILRSDTNCKKTGHCLVPMIKHLYYRLIGDQSKFKINYPEGIQLTDSDSMKFLINLVGDLHQPMHFGFIEDDLGREINGMISINGTNERLSLFEIWESGITRKLKTEKPQFWFGGWTHILAIRDTFDKELLLWKEKGIEMIDDWARENYSIMVNEIYFHPISKQPIIDNFNVDITLEFAWLEIFRSRILIAGARLSIILNEILKLREGKEKPFRATNSLLLSNDEDVSHHISDPMIGINVNKKQIFEINAFGKKVAVSVWIKNLVINLIIILICLSVLAYISIFRLRDNYSVLKNSQLPVSEIKTKNVQMKQTSIID
ncbi:S1 P1 nuclease [Cryptosporidium ubiquitum]|uniref:S1 P1 nuclease n=1 Tax=Cryptosporidium ubiquitum TaxID=857276 RepID=A0A1J4MN22_9CRYT|nr:S1 P1 nuclease [Cryptosporidium ubiquitum]OII74851.1 S1 P1 nuclease [Cryptosporidium ubiquitum]